jgi:hypothetical protein
MDDVGNHPVGRGSRVRRKLNITAAGMALLGFASPGLVSGWQFGTYGAERAGNDSARTLGALLLVVAIKYLATRKSNDLGKAQGRVVAAALLCLVVGQRVNRRVQRGRSGNRIPASHPRIRGTAVGSLTGIHRALQQVPARHHPDGGQPRFIRSPLALPANGFHAASEGVSSDGPNRWASPQSLRALPADVCPPPSGLSGGHRTSATGGFRAARSVQLMSA